MQKDTLKVGIAGYGLVGKRRQYFIDQHPRLHTTAVCDQKFSETGTLPNGVRCFSNYHQLLEEPLDVLFVCLPNYLAAEVTIAGLQQKLHVFCEKPPSRNVEEMQRVIEVERQNPGLLLKYGFNHRYHDSVQAALQIFQSGKLGELVNLRGVYGKSRMILPGGWRTERKYAGGGILLDQGIHMVDLMLLFCGEFKEVKSFISNQYWKHDVEDNAYALMRDHLGRVAMLHSSATQWQHQFNLHIALTEGYLELQGILTGSKSYGEETLIIGRRNESNKGTLQYETFTYLDDNSWGNEVNEFAKALLNGDSFVHGKSVEALATMKHVYQIYYADEQWREKYHIDCLN